MKTKWGSCNTLAGRIWLNLELVKKPPECLEFIVVYELIHLLERRHNERFMTLIDLHLPNWREHRESSTRCRWRLIGGGIKEKWLPWMV